MEFERKWVGFIRLIWAIPVVLLIFTFLVWITQMGYEYNEILPALSELIGSIK